MTKNERTAIKRNVGVLLEQLGGTSEAVATSLQQAGVHTDAFKVVFTAADGYKDSVRLDRALHPDTLLAWLDTVL